MSFFRANLTKAMGYSPVASGKVTTALHEFGKCKHFQQLLELFLFNENNNEMYHNRVKQDGIVSLGM